MRVSISDRCQGHARCLALAPDVFYVNDEGYGAVLGDGEFADDRSELIEKALMNCPENAIRVRRSVAS
jgi:ferredoxin